MTIIITFVKRKATKKIVPLELDPNVAALRTVDNYDFETKIVEMNNNTYEEKPKLSITSF
jgi:hypothetical protein